MDKKLMKRANIFAILALVAGVFYREFTKFNDFVAMRTSLAFIHPHLLVMGSFFLIGLLVFFKNYPAPDQAKLMKYLNAYSLGLVFTVLMMLVRGVSQVLRMELSSGLDHSISGLAGLGHIITGVSLLLILNQMKKSLEA